MAETTTTTTVTKGNKTTSTTTTNTKPGAAWVEGPNNTWIKPPQPSGDYSWDNNKGWVSSAAQAAIWNVPLAIIEADGELKKLFDEAWAAQKGGVEWSKEQFTVRLQGTEWYKSKSESQRKYYTLSKDPAQAAEFAKQIGASKAAIEDAAGTIGVSLTDAQANELAHTTLQNGLNQNEIRNLVSGYIKFASGTDEENVGSLFGEAGDYEDKIRSWAKKNGVTVSNDWVLGQVREIASGNFGVDKSKDYINGIARQQFAGWADKITSDTSVEDLAAGYRQVISDEMDKPIDQVDLSNDYVRNAMLAQGPDGKPITNDSLKSTLRRTDEWASVGKNKEKVLNVANDILSKFGMM